MDLAFGKDFFNLPFFISKFTNDCGWLQVWLVLARERILGCGLKEPGVEHIVNARQCVQMVHV